MQVHRSPPPAYPHGHGLVAATSMKRDGKTSALAPDDRHASVLQRLAERLDRRALELRELVHEQDPAVGERGLPRPRRVTAPDETGGRDRVVRRAERPRRDQAASVQARDAVYAGDLERLGSRVNGGRIDGRRRANIVLPVPGGPSNNRLWPPAAAISSALSGTA